MPKIIDYSKTIIYKIVCKDTEITDIYIGHTTNIKCRKNQHKSCCINPQNKEYNRKIYQKIRETNFDNWEIIMIEQFPCENKLEALKRERYWIEELKPSLNLEIPSRTQKEYQKDNYQKRTEWRHKWESENKEKIQKRVKDYQERNKGRIIETKKEYREKNRELLNQKKREYKQKNIDIIKAKDAIYRENNRQIIREKARLKSIERVICINCQKEMNRSSLYGHIKSKHHETI